MSYSNGSVGVCSCGQMAIASCNRCGRTLCDEHARTLPPAPEGISADALGRYELAIRLADGPHCEGCRADLGNHALAQATNAPRALLPEHWLDRAIALSGDQTRSDAEKLARRRPAGVADGRATSPGSSCAASSASRRSACRSRRRASCATPSTPRAGRSTAAARSTRVSGPGAGRYRLPCLVSVNGEMLGPALEDDRPGQTWWIVPESEIDLPMLVTGVAQLLVLSAFMPPPGHADLLLNPARRDRARWTPRGCSPTSSRSTRSTRRSCRAPPASPRSPPTWRPGWASAACR